MIIQEVNTFCAIYSKSDQGRYVNVNEDTLAAVGTHSINDIVGLKDCDLPWADLAQHYADNEKRVIATRKTHVFYEPCLYNGKPQIYRATKSPIIGRFGKVLGVHGVSLRISDRCLIPLTKQQTACLKQLAMGKTHKQIAQQLGLAQKTVEHYLEAVKLKLNCKTRAELIMQAIERGLVGVF